MNRRLKRFIAFVMTFVVLMPNIVFASETNYVYVPEIDIEDEVKDSNLFYLASSEIEMEENSEGHYLVRVVRGGDVSQEASVVVKMSDITAKYGKDYKVYLYNGGLFNEADKDKDSSSIVEMIEGEDYNEFEINDTEELVQDIQDGVISGSAISEGIAKGINEAVAINKESKGEDSSDYIAAADSAEVIEAETKNIDNSEVIETEISSEELSENAESLNTLLGAKQAFTGIESDRVKPKASMDIIDQFEQLDVYQDVADTISDSMVSATLKLDFAEGESDKYIEIVAIDNNESDSTRIFNITIGDPEGEYTVSAYSTAVATVKDNEEQVKAKVSLATQTVTPDAGKDYVKVTLNREGGLNDLVSVMLKSKSDTAMSGRDFSPVSAEVVFPFGVTERTVDIPINTSYITEESCFDIYIDTPVSCEIGNSETQVVLYPNAGNKSKDNIAKASNSNLSANNDISLYMNDSDYNKSQRVYFPRVYTRNSAIQYIEKSNGFKSTCGAEGDYGWYIRPADDEHWARAEFGVNNEPIRARYDINGLTFSYFGKYAAYPRDGTARIGFRITGYDNYGLETNCWNDWKYTGKWEDWNENTIYTNEGNVRGVQVYATDDSGSGRDIQAHFSDLYPIKRQFKIKLAAADKMQLRTVSGNSTKLAEVQPSAYISNKMSKSLGIDAADTDTFAYRTSGEKITVSVGNNKYFKFKGLYAVNSNNPGEIIKIADANGNNSCTFTLDNDLLTKLIHRGKKDSWDYVTLSDRGGGGKYGNITIKPVFEYIDKKVYVEKNTQFENKMSIDTYNNLGSLYVNGKEYELNDSEFNFEIKPDDSLGKVFHYGDEFIVKTNAKYDDIAKAAGIGYRTGINIDTMDKTRNDLRNNDAEYKFTRKNSDNVLKNDTIAFYPIYTEKQNGLTVMVKKSDIDNGIIDLSYGIMKNFTDNTVDKIIDYREENGKKIEYYRFLASKDVNTDTYYQYSARAKDGYAIKWYDNINKTTYSGNNMFYKPKSLSQNDNIIIISAETGTNVITARFKGTTNYSVYDVSSGTNSSYQMPLQNAAVTIGGVGAVTNEKGEYETSDVGTYIVGTHVIQRIAVDNTFNYVDYVVNISNKKIAVPYQGEYTVETVVSNSTVEKTPEKTEIGWRRVNSLDYVPEDLRSQVVSRKFNLIDWSATSYFVTNLPNNSLFGNIQVYFYPFTKTTYKIEKVEESKVITETKTGTIYTINTGNYNAQITNDGTEIVDVNVYEGDSTYSLPGTIDINDSIYTFRADVRENSDEHIKELKFVIVDPITKKTKYTIPAQYETSSGQWVATEKMDIAMNGTYTSGDTLYAVISTDKNVSGSAGALKEYLPVYTGYDFIQGDSAYDQYEPQNFNLPTNGSFGSLPMLDKLATGFDFPFVSIALEKRPTGEYRVKIGANVTDIVDVAADTTLNNKKDDSGMSFIKDIDWFHHPVQDLKRRASFAYDSVFRKGLKETPLLNGTTTKLGPSQFRFSVVVGGYIDFGKIQATMNGVTYSDFAVTGGGGYIGVSIIFRKAFYFLIAGTVPAYIGGSASGTLIGNMGATRKSNTIVSLSSMKDKQLEIDDALSFNGNLNASMSVALFAGVGLCDILGIRLEGDTDLSLLWEPLAKQTYAMNDEVDEIVNGDYSNAKIHEVGFTVSFSLGGKVDLLLFTIPLMYKFNPIHTGFNKDIQNAHLRKKSTNEQVDVDGATKPTDSTGHITYGWYYVKNVHNNKYLQAKDGKVSFVSKTTEENPAMRFYISTENKYATFKLNEGYGTSSEKYLMMSENKAVVSKTVTDINAYYKFLLREPNIGDFNIISAADSGEKYLMLNVDKEGTEEAIFDKTGTTNNQLWRLEPVNEPITNGLYTIKNNGIGKYVTDTDGKAKLGEKSNSNSQKWYVSVSGDYITIQNAETNKYLYVDSDSQGNGVGISVKENDNSNAIYFDTTKLVDGSYHITTRYSLGKKYLTVYKDNSDLVTNDYNETYNQSWTFVKAEDIVNSNNKKSGFKSMLSSDGVSLFTADNNNDISTISYSYENSYGDDNVLLRKRDTGDSEWVANSGISLFSGFITSNEKTLVKNSYERPDSQVVNLGNGNYMLVFIDTDSSRGELERNVLKFAVYKDGNWSNPSVIQNDGTADFQPNITDAGENVAISWISSAPEVEKTGDPTQYLTTMEVYTTLINKTTGEIGKITRLTNDAYYDYSPTVVYDSTTGDMAVYYIKSSIGNSFLETANSFTNDCIITYMLYDNSKGKWLTDYYYPEEVSDESLAEELIKKWGGQRFLPSPIEDLNMSDPLIVDFTAIGYNGLAVYGYTIDKDNDSSTNEDRDLFIQVYDFKTHKNHPPIRITYDGVYDEGYQSSEVADSMPQFVRKGTGTEGSTYLYWFRGDNKLSNINISDLAHNGLNDDGTISDSYELTPSDVYINLPPKMKQGSNEASASMSYYKVCVDSEDNIYVIWVDLDRETKKQEIFSTTVITDSETGETSYADAYQLTHSGKHNDEPAFLVDEKGNMIVVSTRYNMKKTDDPINPLEITDTELVATVFEPYGELYAEDITVSDTTPKEGDIVNVTAKIYNRGLTVAKGYTVELFEMKGNEKVKTLGTIQSNDYINAGNYSEFNYDWTISNNIEGKSLGIQVTEGNMTNSSLKQTEELKLLPDILLDGIGISQKYDGFYLHTVVTNNGNIATDEGDSINVVYYQEKAPAYMLGIENEQFVKKIVSGIAPNESKEFEIKIDNVNGEMFNAYGYLPVLVAVTNEEGEIISNNEISYIIMDKPIDIKVNNTTQIVLNEGEAVNLSMTFGPSERFNDVTAQYNINDTATAVIVDNQLIGVSSGKTTLIASAQPYGSSTMVDVIVKAIENTTDDTTEAITETTTVSNNRGSGAGSSKAVSTTKETTTEESTEVTTDDVINYNKYEDAFIDIKNHWAREIINAVADKNIVNGYDDNTFKPDNSITRAEFLTILYNSKLADTTDLYADISFADVSGNEWYYDYIKWGVANNIIVGYEDNTFRGNNIISRQEMAVVISKFIKLTNIKFNENNAVVFADNDNIALWAKEYVDSISAYGIIKGDSNNYYNPNKDLTRAEMAVIINQLTK